MAVALRGVASPTAFPTSLSGNGTPPSLESRSIASNMRWGACIDDTVPRSAMSASSRKSTYSLGTSMPLACDSASSRRLACDCTESKRAHCTLLSPIMRVSNM